MATTAEIIIRMKEEHARQIAALRRQVLDFGRETKASMADAKNAADILKDTLGIHLPRELTKLIAQSQLIGPALAASFNVIAIVGFIGALRQIPEAFTAINNAIHGWNEEAKKAWEEQQDRMQKTQRAALDLKIALNDALGKPMQDNIDEISGRLRIAQRHLLDLMGEKIGQIGVGQIRPTGRADAAIEAEIEATKKQITELEDLRRKAAANQEVEAVTLAGRLFEQIVEADKKRIEEEKKHQEEVKNLRDRAEDAWFNYQMMLRKLNKDRLDKQLKDEQDAGDALIELWQQQAKAKLYWQEQLVEFRKGAGAVGAVSGGQFMLITPEEVRMGERGADMIADKIIANMKKIAQEREQFFRDFREGAGHVWDVFATRGQNVLTSLANLTRGLLNTIGRTLFQNFATGLVGGPVTGGGLARSVGGLGTSLGAATGLGAIFGGGTAAAATSMFAAPGVFAGGALAGPALAPALLAGGGGAAAGGIGAALGLGGGAGLLGLGALTIPVVGGIVAGAIFGLSKLFGHRPEAPFTRDPYDAERSRSIFFFTSMADAADRFSRAVDRFAYNTKTAAAVVADGMPAALASSNQFRRNVAGVMLDNDL